MNALTGGKMFSGRYLAATLAIILLGSSAASAQTKSTKPAAPAKPAAVPAKTPAPSAKPGGVATAGAAHGPTTATPHGPTTTAASHGVTTANAGHGVTTANTGHGGPTTAGGRPTTAGGGRGPVGEGHPVAGAHSTFGGRPVGRDSRMVHTANGSEVRMRGGRPADVHMANRGMDIHHGLDGRSRSEVVRSDHSRVVAERGGRGFVEHPYRYGGRDFAHRTYYYHGRAYDHYYGHYYYRGAYVNYYTPAFYYRPAFYGWAYNPWVAPISYSWGWAGNPWYGYYGYYFTPYPVYASASLWLTDYLISTSLAAAYQAQVDANIAAQQAAADAAPLTPQVKDMIAAEVQRQIALENAEAQAPQTVPDATSSSVQRMLTDGAQHIFVAGHDVDVVDAGGAECALSEGDALQLAAPPPPDASAANLVVLSTKGGPECRRGVTVSVAITDLQEMQNHMRETIDQGMGELQAKQGKGIPTIPASANGPPVKAAFAADAPGPDPNAGTEITQQAQQADQAEKDALAQAGQPSGPGPSPADQSTTAPAPVAAPPPPPTTISTGQSIDEVTAAYGQPKSIIDLGTKKIYVFKDVKVTFKNGKVSDVQ